MSKMASRPSSPFLAPPQLLKKNSTAKVSNHSPHLLNFGFFAKVSLITWKKMIVKLVNT